MKIVPACLGILATLAVMTASCASANAEDCSKIPRGPERRACIKREHPAEFEAKLEGCKQLARDRGDTGHTSTGAGGIKEFVRDCTRGKQK